MAYSFEQTKAGYAMLWKSAIVLPERKAAARSIAGKIAASKARYQVVEARDKVPWFLVGCWHYRESDFNFGTYLGNGQSLLRITTEVPAGRGPFGSFEEGASDALRGLRGVSSWTIERILYQSEEYNGEGYFHQNVNDPYVWSWTNQYTSGKYVRDHVFSHSEKDPQCGVAAILKELEEMGFVTFTKEATVPTAPPAVSNANARIQAELHPTQFSLPALNMQEVDLALATISRVLPIAAMFFPPLKVAIPFLPILNGAVKMFEEVGATHASGGDVSSVLASHLESFATQVRAIQPKG